MYACDEALRIIEEYDFTFFDDPKVLADVSRGLGDAMVGINVADLPVAHRLAERGW